MTPNPERDERVTVEQVRELLAKRKTETRPLPSTELYIAHVDYLLSLLDSRAAAQPVGWISCGLRHGHDRIVDIVFENAECAKAFIDGIEPVAGPIVAATRMRDRCVQKVRELRDGWQADADARRDPDNPHDYKGSYGLASGAVDACDDIITALESLTLEGEQEKSK